MIEVENGRRLENGLGRPIPEEAYPSMEYSGLPRVVVTPARTVAYTDETLVIEALVLGEVSEVILSHRTMGQGEFEEISLENQARGVWSTTLPFLTDDLEYYVEAVTTEGIVVWPAAAPEINQTVVVLPFSID